MPQKDSNRKPVVNPNKSTKVSKVGWVVNGGILITAALAQVAELAALPGLQHAAMAASLFVNTVQVCGIVRLISASKNMISSL